VSMLVADIMELSARGIMFVGGFQFLKPCVNARVMTMFPRTQKYIHRFFSEGTLVPLASGAAVPGGAAVSGGMLSAMSSRSVAPASARTARAAAIPRVAPSVARVAPSASRSARIAPSASRVAPSSARSARPARGVRIGRRMRPIAWAAFARPERDEAADVSAMIDSRRAKPTAWARKALSEYVSPLRGLPAVFSIGADGNVAPAKLAGGAAKKRGSAGVKRGGDGAAPGELMRRARAMLQALPDPNAKKTARLVAELENTRPFVLERAGASSAEQRS